ncbi:MAG: MFS transporter [Actinomycetia bacterium]|nr:MFS transporter [Actinomycetes bacterium]MCP3913519.1 MFS transporter [Actinomycetes bacterium]MCP4086481.1 MFS transporter [Actinomycetes bacterium]
MTKLPSARTVLIAFVGAHIVNDFYATILPAFLPALAEEFELDYAELGILSFAFTLLTGVLQPVLGNYADRAGQRRAVVVFGFVAGAGGFVAMAAAPTFWFIVVVSLLCGLGASTYHPQATSFIVHAYPEDRGRMLGIHGWGGSIGHFLAPAVVVLAVSVFDWRWSMLGIAVPLVITAFMLRATLPEADPNPGASLRGAISGQLILVAATFGVISMVGRSFMTFLVKMLVDEGWADTSAGLVLTALLLVGAVAQPVAGRIFDRVGGRTVFLGAAIGVAAFVTLFAVSDGALSLVAVGGIALFMFALFPVSLALASRLGGEGQTGAATGVVFGVSGLMTAGVQPVVGAIAEWAGDLRVALAWMLPMALIAVLLASRIEHGTHRSEPVAS